MISAQKMRKKVRKMRKKCENRNFARNKVGARTTHAHGVKCAQCTALSENIRKMRKN